MTRILHVNKFLYRRGGAESYMLDVGRMQVEAGHEVEFFGMAHQDNDPQRFEERFPSQVDFDPAPAGLVGKARGFGRMLWSSSARRGIDQVLEDYRPDVVHLHNIYHQLSPSILRPIKARGIPMVMTLHDYSLACPTHNFMSHGKICEACLGGHFGNAVRQRCQGGSLAASVAGATELAVHTRLDAYGPVDVFVCPSAFMESKMRQAGVHADRLRHLPHFVHLGRAAKQRPGSGLLLAGRLSFEKGVDQLVRAVGRMSGPVHLDILGEGPEQTGLETLAASVAPGHVTFHGRVSGDEVATRLRAAALSVVPSRWYENQPMSILESYTAGTAVVGSRLGGIPELVTPGHTGELFDHADADDLARVLDRLVSDPELCHRMGLAARAWVEKAFSPTAHLSGLDSLYAEAADRVPATT